MSDPDHERSAAICRQAALPMLRQRHDTIVPRTQAEPETVRITETGQDAGPGHKGRMCAFDGWDFSVGLWLRMPR